MEIYASLKQKVVVNPIDVIEGLKNQEIERRDWVFEKDKKYYLGFEQSAGQHSFDCEKEIEKELYDYIQALELVKSYLEKKNKKNS